MTVKEFNQENSSVYLSVFNNDLKIIERNYFDNLLTITADLSQFIICLIAVFSLQFSLAIIVIIINIIAIFVPVLFSKVLSKKQVTSTQKYSQLNVKIKDFSILLNLLNVFKLLIILFINLIILKINTKQVCKITDMMKDLFQDFQPYLL